MYLTQMVASHPISVFDCRNHAIEQANCNCWPH